MRLFDKDLPVRKISSEQEALDFLNEFENLDMHSKRDNELVEYVATGHDVILRFAQNPDIAEKVTDIIDKNIKCIARVSMETYIFPYVLGKDFIGAACENILSFHSNNNGLAEKWIDMSETVPDNGLAYDFVTKVRDNCHHNSYIANKVFDCCTDRNCRLCRNLSFNDERDAGDRQLSFVKKIIANNQGDESICDKVLAFAEKRLSKKTAEALEDKYCRYECDERSLPVFLAEQNIDSPQIVEKCLEACKDYRKDFLSIIYGKLAIGGYSANGFNDRYADKLNKGEIAVVRNGELAAVRNVADRLTTDVLRVAVVQAGDRIFREEGKARKWHREPNLKPEDYQNRDGLAKLVDERIRQEEIARTKSEKKQPSLIYVEEYAGERYGDWAERVYVKSEKGDYLPTDIVDDLYWGNERSSAREQIEDRGNMLAVEHGVYHRNNADEDFRLLEYNPAYNYRVLDENSYWRDKADGGFHLYTKEAYEGSTLVSKNPVSGGFEALDFPVDYCQGDYLQATNEKEDGSWKTTIYKRSQKDGRFYADAEFPVGEYMGGGYGQENVYSISFMTYSGDRYTYLSDERGSALAKKAKGEKCFQYVGRFSNQPYENQEHKQTPFKDLQELLRRKKGGRAE